MTDVGVARGYLPDKPTLVREEDPVALTSVTAAAAHGRLGNSRSVSRCCACPSHGRCLGGNSRAFVGDARARATTLTRLAR